jgi:hypothetical protein
VPGRCRRELAEASERALRSCVQAGWPTLESVLCIGYVRQGMRLTVLLLAAFVLACCGGSTSTGDAGQSGAASSAPSSALPSPQAARSEFLTGNASPTYPAGTPGQIAVVAQATLALPVPSGGETVPIVVRNNTAHTVTRIAAQGAVHDASRKPDATGSDQGLHPAVLQPGQVALGFIYLGPGSSVPTGSTMTVQVSARPSSSPTTDVADLVVMEVNDTGHQIVGTVKNTRDHSIQAPTASTCSA